MNALTKPQVLELLKVAKAHSERSWLMILVAYRHGLRASEVIAIKREHIRDGRLTVARLKGSERTTQAIKNNSEPLLDLTSLTEFSSLCQFGCPIFGGTRQQFWHLLQKLGKQAGIPADLAHPHILKHSIAMNTIEKAGIHRVKKQLGHKSMSSTGAYLVESDEVAGQKIAEALES